MNATVIFQPARIAALNQTPSAIDRATERADHCRCCAVIRELAEAEERRTMMKLRDVGAFHEEKRS